MLARLLFIWMFLISSAAFASGEVMYIHTDGLGSPVARTDKNGNIISRTRYEPYGATAAGATPTIGFTGHVTDPDTQLIYMQQRYYDPYAGRFLSTDPVLTDANTGGGFNRYIYARNNPYTFIDPDGRDPLAKFKALGIVVRNATIAVHPVTGVKFAGGFPDFSKHAIKTVSIKQTGKNQADFAAANLAAGLKETPSKFTWHHHEDGTTMQLVPTSIHLQTGHSGGGSYARAMAKASIGIAAAMVLGDAGGQIVMGEKESTSENWKSAIGSGLAEAVETAIPFLWTSGDVGAGSDKIPRGANLEVYDPLKDQQRKMESRTRPD